MPNLARLRAFIADFTRLVEGRDEAAIMDAGSRLLSELLAHDDWLPEACAASVPDGYRQYLLHCDALERFSVVSFVWGPAVRSPIHNHTVWGLIGVLRGAEQCEEFALRGGAPERLGSHRLEPGQVDRVSPSIGDVHRVSNALSDRESVSVHVSGANIGAVHRHVFDPEDGSPAEFVSGYSNDVVPNLWDHSRESD